MMRIQYASDLHLEFAANSQYLQDNPLEVSAEILVLAGDIAYLENGVYCEHPFWDWLATHYKQVIVCMGNHEFYNYSDISQLSDGYVLAIRPNVHAYYNAVVHLDDETDIFVSTLWGMIDSEDADLAEHYVSDFHRIMHEGDSLTSQAFNQEHQRCIRFLDGALRASRAKHKIVVSHHVPSFKLQNPDYATSRLNGVFIVELSSFIREHHIDYWIFGHSHYNVDLMIGGTHCVSNQLGYVFRDEHLAFEHGKYIEV